MTLLQLLMYFNGSGFGLVYRLLIGPSLVLFSFIWYASVIISSFVIYLFMHVCCLNFNTVSV